ncbi:hypothetical protein TNIN_392161 [Trichonephila inaurata madagascariensis]|uniref:Uncharacterized protein n=1 Tax=Trichonephila inaurata madagascariensis TaxID=2747483 RepID=A0A8X6X3Y3_9ARAC|nr:hypothetical protein TNIN_392161 [Trichonephila inaurata madagascariensis]
MFWLESRKSCSRRGAGDECLTTVTHLDDLLPVSSEMDGGVTKYAGDAASKRITKTTYFCRIIKDTDGFGLLDRNI